MQRKRIEKEGSQRERCLHSAETPACFTQRSIYLVRNNGKEPELLETTSYEFMADEWEKKKAYVPLKMFLLVEKCVSLPQKEYLKKIKINWKKRIEYKK